MPRFCAMINCGSRADRDTKSFYRLPAVLSTKKPETLNLSMRRRRQWLYMIRRQDLTETKLKWLWVCQDHFISGRPAQLKDTENPDWAPSLNLGYDCDEDENKRKKIKRFSMDVQNEEDSGSSKGDIKLDIDDFEISLENFLQNIDPKETNVDPIIYPNLETAQNSSTTMSEDELDCDPLTYYVYGLKFSNPSCDVTHENAFQSAKTLLMYMESQNDTDLADIVMIRRYMRKIKDKIKVDEV